VGGADGDTKKTTRRREGKSHRINVYSTYCAKMGCCWLVLTGGGCEDNNRLLNTYPFLD